MLDYEKVNACLGVKDPNLLDWDEMKISDNGNVATLEYRMQDKSIEKAFVYLNGNVHCSKKLIEELKENNSY